MVQERRKKKKEGGPAGLPLIYREERPHDLFTLPAVKETRGGERDIQGEIGGKGNTSWNLHSFHHFREVLAGGEMASYF